jgi:murein DD-endopeptidase MepM/ murein hydrolase activator NlpD
MDSKLIYIILFTVGFGSSAIAQTDNSVCELKTAINSAENPCISAMQYKTIEKNCRLNAVIPTASRGILTTALNWPLKASPSLLDCSFYYVSAHVDHDNAATTFRDYNCGTVTYDGHTGTDIAIGPFSFYKMDNNQVEVIAAAAGTIIDKHDGEFDRNCVGVGSGLTANYMIIQHADGSVALYWHMKKNSLTTKIIGQTVAQGEYIGIVGSSGSSSGPHLHFEVWSGITSNTKVDPFSGTCNLINANSWWNVQKPYREPAVLKASVHTTDVVLPGCPNTEIPNESTIYNIPFQGAGLPAGYAKFYIFMRNVSTGTSAVMKIINPNGTIFNTWTYNFTTNNTAGYYGFSKVLPTVSGVYTFEATYNGNSCSQQFTIVNPLTVAHPDADEIRIYPNPARDHFTIHFGQTLHNGVLNLYNELGEKVRAMNAVSGSEMMINRMDMSNGIYLLQLTQEDKTILSRKIIFADF